MWLTVCRILSGHCMCYYIHKIDCMCRKAAAQRLNNSQQLHNNNNKHYVALLCFGAVNAQYACRPMYRENIGCCTALILFSSSSHHLFFRWLLLLLRLRLRLRLSPCLSLTKKKNEPNNVVISRSNNKVECYST